MTDGSARGSILPNAPRTNTAEDILVMLMAPTSARWTLDELDRLPHDGNKYELVDGELFVTPAPSPPHQALAGILLAKLVRYVEAQHLGRIDPPRSVVRARGSEVEPDLMVRAVPSTPIATWDQAPIPSLVVEILSRSTRQRDHEQKRSFYLGIGVAEYWIVDGENRTIRVITTSAEDVVAGDKLMWRPAGAEAPFELDVAEYFREAIG